MILSRFVIIQLYVIEIGYFIAKVLFNDKSHVVNINWYFLNFNLLFTRHPQQFNRLPERVTHPVIGHEHVNQMRIGQIIMPAIKPNTIYQLSMRLFLNQIEILRQIGVCYPQLLFNQPLWRS